MECPNSIARWLAEGGYEAIADKLFNEPRCDWLLLECDSPRAGDFTPQRFVPKGKVAVLGLITSKRGELESRNDIIRRIKSAKTSSGASGLLTGRRGLFTATPNAAARGRAHAGELR